MEKTCTRNIRVGAFAALIAATAAVTAAPGSAQPGVQAPTSMPAQAQARRQSVLAGLPPASLGGPCLSPGRAYLRARIRGAVRLDVDLRGSQLECEGEPRVDGSGIRMGFEGRVGNAGQVRIIFGIDGAKPGRAGRELPTNLTVFFEDKKLLFATQGNGNCTVDRLTQEPVSAGHAPARAARATAKTTARSMTSATHPASTRNAPAREYRVVAHGFCIAPANDLSGRQRILVTTFDFAGRADFNTP